MCVTVFAFFTYLLTVGGYYSYKIKEWYNSAPAERALGSLDPPACSSRPRLKAPAEWIHGERLAQVEHIVGDGVRLCPLEVERPARPRPPAVPRSPTRSRLMRRRGVH